MEQVGAHIAKNLIEEAFSVIDKYEDDERIKALWDIPNVLTDADNLKLELLDKKYQEDEDSVMEKMLSVFSNINRDSINQTHIGWDEAPADTARRERSISILKERGIPFLPQLYVIAPESGAQLRTPEETARRLLAMLGVCVYSEVRSGGKDWDDAQKYLSKIDDILSGGLNEALTPEEKRYLSEKEPGQRSIAKFGWRYECCHVLMWALGFFDELGYPKGICDVSRMGKIIWHLNSVDSFLGNTKPRERNEILDMADLILRYDWACVDARINNRESPAGLNGEVTVEWHYAFEWLVGSNNAADWDDVSPNT